MEMTAKPCIIPHNRQNFLENSCMLWYPTDEVIFVLFELEYYQGESGGFKRPHVQRNRCFPFTVLVYVCRGAYFCTIGEEEIAVLPGETLLVPPCIYHSIRMEAEGVLHWGHISFAAQGEELTAGRVFPRKLTGERSEEVGACLKELAEAGALSDEALRKARTGHLIARLYDRILSASSPAQRDGRLERVRALLEKNPGESYRLDQLAELAGMSPRGFEGRFKREIGISPFQYLCECRVKRAAFLLASGMRVCEVAEQTGYYDAYHFSRQFKRIIGVSPSDYAKTHTIDA